MAIALAFIAPWAQTADVAATPSRQGQAAGGVEGQNAGDLPQADELLVQSLDAIGGRSIVERLTSREALGYMQTPNGEVTVTILSGAGDKFLIRQGFPGDIEILFGSDGTTLWSRDPQGGYRLLDPSQTAQIRQLDCLSLVDEMLRRYPTRQTMSREVIAGHDVYRVKLTGGGSADQLDVFIDTESKLLRGKEINKVAGAGGIIKLRFIFDDWKQFGDVKLFTKVTVLQGEQSTGSIAFTEIRHNAVDAAAFDLPAEVRKLLEVSDALPGNAPATSPPGPR